MTEIILKSTSKGKRVVAFAFFLVSLTSLTANVAAARPIKIPPPPPPPVQDPMGAIINILETLIIP